MEPCQSRFARRPVVLVQQINGPGSFSYDSSTCSYTYTPSQSDQSPALIEFTANDGTLTSNKASLIFAGWKLGEADIGEDDQGVADGDDNAVIPGQNLPTASNQTLSVSQNGSLQVYASAGLLSNASDTDDPATDTDTLAVEGQLIEAPLHGSLSSVNNSDGSYTYTPDSGFTGRDYFTWRVDDGSKNGDYATVFIDVTPVTVSVSVNNLKPGDATAMIPSTQFPQDAAGDSQYAAINLNVAGNLPDGSTVTLSVNSDVLQNLDVYDNVPGQAGSNIVIGKDADASSYTWTVGDPNTPPPSTVYAVGLSGTSYDQAVFTLSVAVAGQTAGNAPAIRPAQTTPPATQPIRTTQPTTVPGRNGALEAFDGTTDVEADQTDIYLFQQAYEGTRSKYWRGVANRVDQPNRLLRILPYAFGDGQALAIERSGLHDLITFYQDPTHLGIPVDVIGYSRGAIETVKLVNDLLTNGIPNLQSKVTNRSGSSAPAVTFASTPANVRFVGIISAVIGPFQVPGLWPKSIPQGVAWMYQALDFEPLDPFLPQYTIPRPAGTQGHTITYQLPHPKIGYSGLVNANLFAEAQRAGVPFKPVP